MTATGEPALDRSVLRRVFGTFATGVTVVTVGGGEPHGMTANSFTAVSLDPPLLLVCVEHDAVMHEALVAAGRFAVSVLAAGHGPVARYFADRRRPLGGEQFVSVDVHPGEHTGAPLIDGALAHFECALWNAYDGGDHTIFIGRLLDARCGEDDAALLFHRGRLSPADRDPSGVAA
ncbi:MULTISPECIES: flavin reductase family protein [Actinoplanes]|uniref:flavin reductase family protein n=1 Tax=Actinoplanes TaxID=1865 RepID=UPI0005F2919F|nr:MULTISPECIES: flavin reductase family protein [Actinoplanes]GLY00482.1 oxidoreductase [Actinoplanes sp. NBRC 101535]